jgi:hypothetical protein
LANLHAAAFRLASAQATIFTPDASISTAQLVRDLLPKWLNEPFDGEPLILPQPPVDALPRDIPRVVLQSSKGEMRCELAAARVNMYWTRTSANTPDPDLGAFFARTTGLFSDYLRVLPTRVGRLAAVINRFAQHESPGAFLAEQFCKPELRRAPFNRPESFELHAHKKFALSGRFEVNSWVRNKTGASHFDELSSAIVLVEQDLNTLAESAAAEAFTEQDISEYFALCARNFDNILALYYPE